MRPEIFSHIKSKIDAAEIIEYPFPHLLINDFFPVDLYQEMIDNFPSSPTGKNADGDNYLAPEDDWRLSDMDRALWSLVRDDIYPAVMNIVQKKLIVYVFKRCEELHKSHFLPKLSFGDINDWELLTNPLDGFQLLQRTEGFSIPPHLHGPYEYIDILHYLPNDDSAKDHGTQLYPVIAPFEANIPVANYPSPPSQSLGEPVVIPYLPNTALIYVNTFRTIHGKAKFDGQPKRRYIFGYRMFNNDCVNTAAFPVKSMVHPFK